MKASTASSQPGLVLGRYRPLRPLGSGGSGSVWLARDEKSGRDVALKTVSRAGNAGARAEREAAAAARLRHPACLRVYALGRDADHVYIASEYVAGRTLRHALIDGELDEQAAIEAAAQILDGLAHAHAHGIVHRDVKPANVLVEDSPEVSIRLLDFGLALMAEEETLTAAGDVPGTLAYISPERLKGETAGPAADVWSVGVLLWEALAGQHPFVGGSGRFLEMVKKIEKGAPSLATARPDLPKPIVQAVDRALAADPAKRPSARKLASALRRSLSPQSHPRPLARPGRLERLLPAAPAAALTAWATATLPFFPTHWPAGLAVLAALSAALSARSGLLLALAAPVLPLGNISLGLGIVYATAAVAWASLFWTRPRAGLVFVVGPLLGPLGLLGLLPVAALAAGGAARRAATVLGAAFAAALVGRSGPDVALAELERPLDVLAELWRAAAAVAPQGREAVVLAAAAVILPYLRRHGPWGGAAYGAALLAAGVLVTSELSPWPLVAAAWLTGIALALEPPGPEFAARRRFMPVPGSAR